MSNQDTAKLPSELRGALPWWIQLAMPSKKKQLTKCGSWCAGTSHMLELKESTSHMLYTMGGRYFTQIGAHRTHQAHRQCINMKYPM